jgi:glycosyltransferase involved in cell wall biosynthesis
MTRTVPISIVIAAHDEEAVLGRCLDALLRDVRRDELEIAVVCNGCTDRTADVARGYGAPVGVVETSTASKTAALNLGDEVVSGFPRFYVDADVVLPLRSVRRVASRLAKNDALAASPMMEVDLGSATLPVRAYYRGVYALSEEGRRRFGEFPPVIADDGYVRMLFGGTERVRVDDAPVRVFVPSRLSDLVRIKTRSRLGRYQLAQRFPELVARERTTKSYRTAVLGIVIRPWLWPAAAVYAAVLVQTRRRARRQLGSLGDYVWERDASSRRR